MKSKKASEILERARCYTSNDEIYTSDKPSCCNMVGHIDAFLAVEIAEAERDAKAVEVFKQMCPFHDGRCRPNCEGCARLNQFIQKLNEE